MPGKHFELLVRIELNVDKTLQNWMNILYSGVQPQIITLKKRQNMCRWNYSVVFLFDHCDTRFTWNNKLFIFCFIQGHWGPEYWPWGRQWSLHDCDHRITVTPWKNSRGNWGTSCLSTNNSYSVIFNVRGLCKSCPWIHLLLIIIIWITSFVFKIEPVGNLNRFVLNTFKRVVLIRIQGIW